MKIFTKKNWKSLIAQGEERLPERLKEALSSCDKLDLYSCSITQPQVEAIAYALEHNSTLTSIKLRVNDIEDEGAKAIAKALKHNSTLISINLCSNYITGKGARALAEALKHNSSLSSINLLGNFIGSGGAKALLDAIKVNRKITTVNSYPGALFHATNVNADIKKQIKEAIKENRKFQALCEDIEGNNFSKFNIKTLNKFIPLIEESIRRTPCEALRKRYDRILNKLNYKHYYPKFFPLQGIAKELISEEKIVKEEAVEEVIKGEAVAKEVIEEKQINDELVEKKAVVEEVVKEEGIEENENKLFPLHLLPPEVLSRVLDYVGLDVNHTKAQPIVSDTSQDEVNSSGLRNTQAPSIISDISQDEVDSSDLVSAQALPTAINTPWYQNRLYMGGVAACVIISVVILWQCGAFACLSSIASSFVINGVPEYFSAVASNITTTTIGLSV